MRTIAKRVIRIDSLRCRAVDEESILSFLSGYTRATEIEVTQYLNEMNVL